MFSFFQKAYATTVAFPIGANLPKPLHYLPMRVCLAPLVSLLKCFFLVTTLFSVTTLADRLVSPHVDVALVSDVLAVRSDEKFTVGVSFKPEAGWHVYWRYAGDSGSPPRINWKLPEGMSMGDLNWPTPERIQVGPLVNYGYSDEVSLTSVASYSGKATSIAVQADIEWLVCKEECIPGAAVLSLALPVQPTSVPNERVKAQFAAALGRTPESVSPEILHAQVSPDEILLHVSAQVPKDSEILFFPERPYLKNAAPQNVTIADSSITLRLIRNNSFQDGSADFRGVLSSSKGFSGTNTEESIVIATPLIVVPTAESTPTTSFWSSLLTALLFGFFGGLLLNVMPCVLPVLSLKLLTFTEQDARTRMSDAIWYTVGLFTTMLAIASVLIFTKQLGWGFQLQSPNLVAILSVIVLLVTLNVCGVFEFTGAFRSILSKKITVGHRFAEFFNGILITILATPCSAPFMASAIGYALASSPLVAYTVFLSLAFGLCLPVLLIAAVPRLLRWVPKPGNWMIALKQILAFPLFGTIIWLLWIFGLQTDLNAVMKLLCLLLAAAFAAWLFHRRWLPYKIVAVAILISCFSVASRFTPVEVSLATDLSAPYGGLPTETYSPERLQSLLKSGKAVYVDFTAAWCITCQVNKKVVFSSLSAVEFLHKENVTVLVADWTTQDTMIAKELERYGRKGVPLNVAYKTGDATPIILPQLLTPSMVTEAFK